MLIFGTGVVTGGLLVGSMRFRDHHSAHPTLPNRPAQSPNSPGGLRLEFLRRMEGELNLAPEQRERVDQIIKESQDRARKVIAPRMREEAQKTREDFREMLTPEQRVRFDELWKQQRTRDQRKATPPRDRPATSPSPTNAAPVPP
jgi:Spy/CpxP family protein refolding chaperone